MTLYFIMISEVREDDAPEYHGYFVLNTSFRVQPMDPRTYG